MFDEFLKALRGKMNQRRKNLVKLAFDSWIRPATALYLEDPWAFTASREPGRHQRHFTPDQAFQSSPSGTGTAAARPPR